MSSGPTVHFYTVPTATHFPAVMRRKYAYSPVTLFDIALDQVYPLFLSLGLWQRLNISKDVKLSRFFVPRVTAHARYKNKQHSKI